MVGVADLSGDAGSSMTGRCRVVVRSICVHRRRGRSDKDVWSRAIGGEVEGTKISVALRDISMLVV